MPFDSQIRLRQLHNPELSGYILEIIGKYVTTGSGVSVNTGSLTGAFYPLRDNPSGYLNFLNTGTLVDHTYLSASNASLLAQIALLYYPLSNPSGFGTGNSSGNNVDTGAFLSLIDQYHNTGLTLLNLNNSTPFRFTNTGFYIDSLNGGATVASKIDFKNAEISGYDLFNCAQTNFNTNIDWKYNGNSVLEFNPTSKSFLIKSPQYSDFFYDITSGKLVASGISGWGITGTDAFALLNTNVGVKNATGFKYAQEREYYLSGSGTKIDLYKRIISGFEISGYLSNSNFLSSSGYLDNKISNLIVNVLALSGVAVLTGDLVLYDEQAGQSVLWGYNTRKLLTNTAVPSIDWQNRELIYRDNQATVNWEEMKLRTDDPPAVRVDWRYGYLSGIWDAQHFTVSGQPVLTGSMTQFLSKASGDNLYYSIDNPGNYITASYVNGKFAPLNDYISRSSLSLNSSLHLIDSSSPSSFNSMGYKQGEFFYLRDSGAKNVVDVYSGIISGFNINATSIKISGQPVALISSLAGYARLGVSSSNTHLRLTDSLFGGAIEPFAFKQGEHFYMGHPSGLYLIDIYNGQIVNFDATGSFRIFKDNNSSELVFSYNPASGEYYLASDNGYIDLANGEMELPTAGFIDLFASGYRVLTTADLGSISGGGGTGTSPLPPNVITGSGTAGFIPIFTGQTGIRNSILSQSGASIRVNGLPVITQVFNTGDGSGIYNSTDNVNSIYFKTLVPSIGISISGSGDSLVFSTRDAYYDTSNYSSFGSLISGIGSTSGTILVTSSVNVNSNLTIPRNIELVFLNSGLISVASNATLNVFNKFKAPAKQIFSMVGNYNFSGNQNAGETSFAQWFGVVADGNGITGTDNWRALSNLNRYLYANDGLNVKFPRGIICTSHHTWLLSIKNASLDFCGSTGQYIGPSQQYGVSWFLSVNNETTLDYPIGNEYQLVYKNPQSFIYSTVTGSKTVRLKNVSDVTGYASGSWLQVAGYEQQGGGFPRNYRYFEYRKIASIHTGSGILTLDRPLQNTYNEHWYSYSGDANVGPACLMSLDREYYHFSENISIENLNIIGANTGYLYLTSGFYGIEALDQTAGLLIAGCKKFVGKNIRAEQMFVQAGETYEFDNCRITYVEPDKQLNNLICRNSDFEVFIQGASIDNIHLENCNFYRFLAVYPRNLKVENCVYHNLTYNQGFSIPSAWYGVSYQFINNKINFPTNSFNEMFAGYITEVGSSYVNPQGPNTCVAISGNGLSRFATDANINNFALRLSMGKGTVLKSPSGKKVTVSDITYDSGNRRFLIDYVGTPISSGDRLYYYTLLNLYAEGNSSFAGFNTIPQAQQYIPSQIYVNPTDGVTNNSFDVSWRDFSAGTPKYQFVDGFINEISINITKAAVISGDPRMLIYVTHPHGNSKEILVDTSYTGLRRITEFTSYGEQNTDSLSVYGNDYINTFGIYVFDADNSGSSGFMGTIRFKGRKQ